MLRLILALFTAMLLATPAAAQMLNPTEPQIGIWYMACSSPSNKTDVEFRNARIAAETLTFRQLRDPWAAIRTHTTKRKLPKNCRRAVQVSPQTTLNDVECVLSKDGQLVILREIEQINGFFQVVIIADTQWLAGVPRICRR